MFTFTYHSIEYTADDDGNVDSSDNDADIDRARDWWCDVGWQRALQDEADNRADQRRYDRSET